MTGEGTTPADEPTDDGGTLKRFPQLVRRGDMDDDALVHAYAEALDQLRHDLDGERA